MGYIPDRWTNYSAMGRQIPGTRLIAFKTPLTQENCSKNLSNDAQFSTRTLMDHCSNLGLVIDLTFKKPAYYRTSDLTDQNIQYLKIAVPGKQIPHDEYVYKFFNAIEEFVKVNNNNDKLVGVHCTHGLNRTGYLICRYMIECLKVPADQAILDFDSARGHNQEREHYLASLRRTVPNQGYIKWLQKKNDNQHNTATRHRNSMRTPDHRRKSRKRSLDELDLDSNYGGWNDGAPSAKRVRYDSQYVPSPRPRDSTPSSSCDRHDVGFYGQRYYEQYYRGPVNQQYDMNFYVNSRPSPYRLRNRPSPYNHPDTHISPYNFRRRDSNPPTHLRFARRSRSYVDNSYTP